AAAAGLTAIALAKDNQAVLFSALTAGLIVIAGAATWRKAFHSTESVSQIAERLDDFDRYCAEHPEITLPLSDQPELYAA
ncbi:MAG: hypothetical protein IID15_07670, partial [Candidatus Marinimicrobia bacterium]|nr:hypothetical protein [Candidatus Neomarinimicrobiota bacterium]